MPDTKISALPAVTALTDNAEFAVNDGGVSRKVTGLQLQEYARRIVNQSIASQQVNAATTAYLAGSGLVVPASGLRVGSTFRWLLSLSKTAAGTAANTFDVRFGTAGTTADTTRLAFDTGTATAAADQGQIEITCTVRSISGSGTVQGLFTLQHELAATGLHNKATRVHHVASNAFATNAANLIVGVSVTTAASTVLTFQQVVSEARNL
jgi:hypothetical protein